MGFNDEEKIRHAASVIQQQYWLLNNTFPGNSAYNVSSVFLIEGSLNIEYLRQAFNCLVLKHSIFSSTFEIVDGKLMQVVKTQSDVHIDSMDLSGHSGERIQSQINDEASQPFDLEKGPLLRVKIINESDNKNYLIITMHHIITDLFTKDKFGEELSGFYHSLVSGQGLDCENTDVQYTNYSAFHNDWLNSEESQSMQTFWEDNLKDRNHFLNFPYSFKRPLLQSLKGDAIPFGLSKSFTDELKQFSRKNRVNSYLTLLTAYFILLHRYSGQDDITVGVPLSNRRNQPYSQIMGCLVSILPVSVDFSTELTFSDVLKQVRAGMLNAHRNQEVPFTNIVNAVKPKRDTSFNPLFQVGFTFEHPMKINLAKTICTSVPIHSGGSQLDLFPVLWESEDGIKGHIEYCTDLFDASFIEAFSIHYKKLLESIITSSEQPVATLPILSETEKNLMLNVWNDTSKDYPEEDGIHLIFEKQVEKTPDAIALEYNDARYTYQELNQRANRLANLLIESGVKNNTRVGIFMDRSVEMVVAIYGILKAGGAYVPFDPEYPEARLDYMFEDTNVPVFLTQRHLQERLIKYRSTVVSVDSQWEDISAYADNNPDIDIKASDSAYVIYTSGSTGKPKGVINSHNGIINRIQWMQDEFEINDSDAILQKTPYSFDVSVWEFLWPLIVGAKLVIAPPESHKDPMELISIIKEKGITTLHFVPSMLHAFLSHPDASSCTCIKRVICSGEALSVELQKEFYHSFNTELNNLYGPTEAAVDVTHWICKKEEQKSFVPIGKPIANTTVYILDNHMAPVPVGVSGELHIGGVQVAKGYLNKPELTNERFVPNPFTDETDAKLYKTGDVCRFLPDGNIEYIGRSDFQVKIRGFRIELGEIESALYDHPDVEKTVVVTKEYGQKDARLVAYILPKDTNNSFDENALVEELKTLLLKKLPEYMVPSVFSFIDEIPMTQSGKIDRNSLPDVEIQRSDSHSEYVSPKTETEKILVDIWGSVLKTDKVGVLDNFFDIGGNSLLSAILASQIREELKADISVAKIFQYPNIRVFSRYLQKNENTSLITAAKKRANNRKRSIERKSGKYKIATKRSRKDE